MAEELTIEQRFREQGHKLLVTYTSPQNIHLMETWGLKEALKIAIDYEEYEICETIKNEIERRNEQK